MSKRSYFEHYVNPNIIIVPTVSFSPPKIEKTVDLNTNSGLSECHQTAVNNIKEPWLPLPPICNNQDFKEDFVNSDLKSEGLATTMPDTSDYYDNSLHKEDIIFTQVPTTRQHNMNQSVKELSLSKYKSRNNLVDLTGFNILKRDIKISLTKKNCPLTSNEYNDNNNDNSKTDIYKTINKTVNEKERRSDLCSTNEVDTTSDEKSIKGAKQNLEEFVSNNKQIDKLKSKENVKQNRVKEDTDMENKMKKYLKQLQNPNIEKLQEKSNKEKQDRDIRSKFKQCLDVHRFTKHKNNETIETSKRFHDIERNFLAQCSKLSKSKTIGNESATAKSTELQEEYSSSSYIKKYKHFIHHYNDHEKDHKISKQIEATRDKKILTKFNNNTTNKSEFKNKAEESKHHVKRKLYNKEDDKLVNKERTNLIKSVVIVKNSFSYDYLKNKRNHEDLRARLSRKRTRSDCIAQRRNNLQDRENLVITVTQDINDDSEPSTSLDKNVDEPEIKKYKQLNFNLSIDWHNSNSDDSDENINESVSPQDLSFLDDFDVDEIVDSLNIKPSQKENKINMTNKAISPFIYNINDIVNANKGRDEIHLTDIKTEEMQPSESTTAEIKQSKITPETYYNSYLSRKISPEQILQSNITTKEIQSRKITTEEVHTDKITPQEINSSKTTTQTIHPCKVTLTEIKVSKITTEETQPKINMTKEFQRSKTPTEQIQPNKTAIKKTQSNKITTKETESNIIVTSKELQPSKTPTEQTQSKKNTTEEIQPIANKAIQSIKIATEELNKKDHVIEIYSDSGIENSTLEKGFISCSEHFKVEPRLTNNLQVDINAKQKHVTDLAEETIEKVVPEVLIDLCDDTKDSVIEVIDITDDEKYNTSMDSLSIKLCGTNNARVERSFEIVSLNRPKVIENAENLIQRVQHILASKDNTHKMMIEENLGPPKDPIAASLETMFNNIEKYKSDVNEHAEPINSEDISINEVNISSQKHADTVEASLETMFNNIERNKSDVNEHTESIDSEYVSIKEVNISSKKHADTVEASLETMFNNIERNKSDVNEHSKTINSEDLPIKGVNMSCQKHADTVEASLETMFNNIERNKLDVNEHTKSLNSEYVSIKERNISSKKHADTLEASLETMFNNIERNKSDVNEHSKPINSEDISIKGVNISSQKQADTVEASLESLFNNIERNKSDVNKHKEPINSEDISIKEVHISSRKDTDSVEASLESMFKNIEQDYYNKIHIEALNAAVLKEEIYLQKSRDAEASFETMLINNKVDNEAPNESCPYIKEAAKIIQVDPRIIEIPHNNINYRDNQHTVIQHAFGVSKDNNQKTDMIQINIEQCRSDKNIKQNTEHERVQEDTNIISPAINDSTAHSEISSVEEESSQICHKSIKSSEKLNENIEMRINCKPDMTDQCLPNEDKTVHLKNFKNSFADCLEEQKNTEKTTNIKMTIKKTQVRDIKAKLVNHILFSNASKTLSGSIENTLGKKAESHVLDKDIVPDTAKTSAANISNLTENPKYIRQFKNIITRSTVDEVFTNHCLKSPNNDSEQRTDIVSEIDLANTADNSINEPIQSLTSKMLQEITNNSIQVTANLNKNAKLLTDTDKYIPNSAKSLKENNMAINETNNQTNDKMDHAKSLDNEKRDVIKPGSSTDVPNDKIISADSEANKRIETKMVLNSKTKVQVLSNIKDENNTTKEELVPVHMRAFASELESRMLTYLDKKYTVTSLIRSGRYSKIYKCQDSKENVYAIKVVNMFNKNMGLHMEKMLSEIKKDRPKENAHILYLFNGFGVLRHWCLLTEFYPNNLANALADNETGFNINLVQILAKQLVVALKALNSHNIVHSDIKPVHILLNNNNNRLKLCGFDRSNYLNRININPSSGTSNYRAPEIILGFAEYSRIDIWSAATVLFEMFTNTKLFPGTFNNEILYHQLRTLGSLDSSMVENSENTHIHFTGTSFKRQIAYKEFIIIHAFHRNDRLRKLLYSQYNRYWAPSRRGWQYNKDVTKLEAFYALLERMLMLDPRVRMPIHFVAISAFLHCH